VNEEQKKQYLEKYRQAKAGGWKFYPDIIYKDLLASFAIFVLLVGLSIYVGVAAEPPADPSDSAYIPRPEWYFLFLFQMLKYFPGKLEWVGTVILPGAAVLALFLLPFYDRSPFRYWKKRKLAVGVMSAIVVGMVALTVIAAVTTPPQEEANLATSLSESILLGSDLFSVQCVECHGAEGEGGEIKGVEGLENVVVKPINSQDEMYTHLDDTLYAIIDYGQPALGMTPFGVGYGGELRRGDIQAIVNFMRYTWDDRSELPAEVAQANAMPALAPDQVPSYVEYVAPIFKRNCVSCHRPGKKNNNYWMRTYEEVIDTGDSAPNVFRGDLTSNMVRMLERQEIDAGGPMPPTKALKPEWIDIIKRWIVAGMPNTAEDAAALSAPVTTAIPEETSATTPTP
jgi:mono/diheme cytochrome c family protein